MTVRKHLDVSNFHLPFSVAMLLESEDTPLTHMIGTYGWLIYVPEDNSGPFLSIRNELHPIMDYARKHDCDYILFDRDAEVCEEIPNFEDTWS